VSAANPGGTIASGASFAGSQHSYSDSGHNGKKEVLDHMVRLEVDINPEGQASVFSFY